MKQAVGYIFCRFVVLWCLLLLVAPLQADDGGGVLDRKIRITQNKGTKYQLLRHVSEQSGYFFVYDSQIINNDEVVKIHKGEYTIQNAIYAITGNNALKISLLGSHILLSLPVAEQKEVIHYKEKPHDKFLTLKGRVYDALSKEVIPYVSVSMSNGSIGSITNQDGEFKLVIPDSLSHSSIKLSHVGYLNEEVKASALVDRYTEILLEPKVISLQEVVVRAVNPLHVLQKMQDERERNYSSVPVYLTTFYREVIEHKKKNIDLTEAVLKVYKNAYRKISTMDQVKLIKMRRVFKKQESDTIFTKMKSGVKSSLTLDIIKEMPDFLTPKTGESTFVYRYTDISEIDKRRIYIISFEQNKDITEPLYKGQLYIDTENYALLEAHFEINPIYAEKATDIFVEKKSHDYKLTLKRAAYTVSYKPSADGVYYVNHVRGDLEFKVKRKHRFFSTSLNLWFEMVTCKTDLENVRGFSRSERLSTRNVFSETKYEYDANFWEHFNVIVPEDELKDLIINNLGEVTTAPVPDEDANEE
ncbi:carboxypeptidase-like regulatory domain-containing protein [Bacteroides ihuae]|uniref:carboxypeptidase-like regulatory domain-containing protein n=1 Tax=Bacteroides ihuae TaxID=1852362 RepID=UPI0008DA22C2|nr:carboxypeptidase-like regulatory domain-containing protein [Bacteroides ihuae]